MQPMWNVRKVTRNAGALSAALAGVLLAATTAAAQAPASPRPDPGFNEDAAAAEVSTAPPRLAGVWRTQPDRFPLLTEFDKSVWGANAQSEQSVELTMNASGEGTLLVTRRVLDARGRTVPGSASVDQAKITVGPAKGPAVATRLEHAVTVTSAERRYPDDPTYKWPVDGARVNVVTFDGGDPNTIEVRYDSPDGKVAIAEVLRRSTGKASARPRAAAASKPAAAATGAKKSTEYAGGEARG
jgi:hypothetical protein